MAPSPSLTPTETFYTFAVSLYVYEVTKPKKTAKGKTVVPKEEKKKEIKELKFSLNNSNYLPFLQSLLEKHSVTVQGQDLLFSIVHLSLSSFESLLTFTVSIMFFTNTFCYIVW